MSQILIRRLTQQIAVTLQTTTSLATTLSLEGFAGGAIDLGTLSTSVTSLQMWAASGPSGEFRRLRKPDGSAVDLTLSPSTADGGFYALPDEVFAVPYLRLVAGAAAAVDVPGVVTLKT
jgi:hypothetical protein